MNRPTHDTHYASPRLVPTRRATPSNRHRPLLNTTNPLTSTVNIDPKSHKNYLTKKQQHQQHPTRHTLEDSSYDHRTPLDPSLLQSDVDCSQAHADADAHAVWSITDRLRLWRDDARAQHLYQSAAFWGSKVYNLTSNPNDAFWLAQVFFLTGQFFRAEKVLTSAKRIPIHPDHSDHLEHSEQGQERDWDQFSFTSDSHHQHTSQSHHTLHQDFSFWNDLLPDPHPNHDQSGNEKQPAEEGFSQKEQQQPQPEPESEPPTLLVRMTDYSTACRYLAAQCMIRQGKWDDALEMVGHENPFRLNPTTAVPTTHRQSDLSLSPPQPAPATTHHPTPNQQEQPPTTTNNNNNHNHEKLNKKNYLRHQAGKAAMDGGIKFESSMSYLRGLIHLHHKLLDRAKESFLESLALDVKCYESFEALVGGNMLEPEEEWEFIQTLEYNSQTPEDAIFIKSLYTIRLKKFNHKDEIFNSLNVLKNQFDLSDDPDIAFGLADWLFTNYRFIDCYRITSRILKLHYHHLPTLPLHLTCMAMIKRLLPSLFLLAHQLIERDSNSPISWYAAGLWYFSQKRWEESRRFFSKSALLDSRFPEAWFAFGHALAYEGEHDQAITAYSTASHNFQGWQEAIEFFNKTIQLIDQSQTDPIIWAPVHLNLSHCYRRLKQYSKSLESAEATRLLIPRSSVVLTAIGMAHHGLGNNLEAINFYHQSLAILPADPMTTSLLQFSLDVETRPTHPNPHQTKQAAADTPPFRRAANVGDDDDQHHPPPGLLKQLISRKVLKDWEVDLDP